MNILENVALVFTTLVTAIRILDWYLAKKTSKILNANVFCKNTYKPVVEIKPGGT